MVRYGVIIELTFCFWINLRVLFNNPGPLAIDWFYLKMADILLSRIRPARFFLVGERLSLR